MSKVAAWVAIASLSLPAAVTAQPVDLTHLTWSVQYMIDQSQTVLGQDQGTAPRDARGLAISPDGRYLYAGYNNGPEVRKIDLTAPDYTDATIIRTTVSRGKAIATDDVGRVYLAEGTGIRIYDADLSSLQHSVATTTCEGVAVAREGSQLVLYGSDRTTGNLTRYLLSESSGMVTGSSVDTAWGSSGLVTLTSNLRGVEVDPQGRIWVAGYASNAVYVVAANGQSYETISNLTTPIDIGFDEGQALVAQYTQRQIAVLDTMSLSLLDVLTVPWTGLELDADGQSGGGALSGIVVLPGEGFYVANEAGQTADEKSTYGRVDGYSGWLDGKYYTALTHDDNDPILYATPEPGTLSLLGLAGLGLLARKRRYGG